MIISNAHKALLLRILPVTLLIVSALVFWHELVFGQKTIFFDLTTRYFHPIAALLKESINAGQLPFWNPYIYCGMPFLANPQSAVFYPFSYLFVFFGYPAALNIFIVSHCLLAGIFIYRLAKESGYDGYGASAAALIFMFNGYFVLHTEFTSNIACYVWLPAIVLFAKRYARTSLLSQALLAGLCMALQFLGGHPGYFYYTIFYLLLYLVFAEKEYKLLPSLRTTAGFLALAFTSAALLSAAQLMPALELASGASRGAGLGIAESLTYSIRPSDYLRFLTVPLWDYLSPFYSGDIHIIGFYFGIISLILIAVTAHKPRTRMQNFMIITFVLFSVLSLGRHTPLYKIFYYAVPGWKLFGFPGQLMFLAAFSFSMMAGYAVSNIKSSRLKAALAALIFLELFLFNIKANRLISARYYGGMTGNIEFLSMDKNPFRLILTPRTYNEPPESDPDYYKRWLNFKDMLYPNTGAAYGFSYADGNETMKQRRIFELLGAVTDPSSKILDIMNVKYLLSRWDLTKSNLELRKDGYIKIYENTDHLPRYYLAAKAEFRDKGAILKELKEGSLESLKDTVYIEGLPEEGVLATSKAVAGGKVRIESYTPSDYSLYAEAPAGGWLVSGESYYPGWEAEVDGSPAEIRRANYNFKAVYLEPGAHIVRFSYFPSHFKLWSSISAISFILCLLLISFWGKSVLFARGKRI